MFVLEKRKLHHDAETTLREKSLEGNASQLALLVVDFRLCPPILRMVWMSPDREQ